MGEDKKAEQLVMRWVPVVDDQGRTHMEASWAAPEATPAPAIGVHAA